MKDLAETIPTEQPPGGRKPQRQPIAAHDIDSRILDAGVSTALLIAGRFDGGGAPSPDEMERRLRFYRRAVETLLADLRRMEADAGATSREGRRAVANAWEARLRALSASSG